MSNHLNRRSVFFVLTVDIGDEGRVQQIEAMRRDKHELEQRVISLSQQVEVRGNHDY